MIHLMINPWLDKKNQKPTPLKMMSYYMKEMKKYPPLSKEDEIKWIKKAKAGDRLAYEKIISANLRFVFQVAKSYQGKGLSLEDLIAEGNMGLVKAFERFDPTKEVKFISYAVWWIRQCILSSLYTNGSTIRLPLNKLVNVSKINKIKDSLEQELLREPTLTEIEAEIDDPAIKDDIDYLHTIISLDVERTDSGEATLHEVLPDEGAYFDERMHSFQDDFEDVIRDFPDREKQILRMYYGIGFRRTYNLREIGLDLNLTRERIRQIKEKSLEKIRNKKEGETLLDYL